MGTGQSQNIGHGELHPLDRRAWAEVDLGQIEKNYRLLQAHVGTGVGLVGIVKANAYGHGAVPVAKRLEKLGAPMLATATLREAASLREAGIAKPILVLGGCLPGQEREAVALDVTPSVYTIEALAGLSGAAREAGKRVRYHLKVDTGMGRLGVQMADVLHFVGEATRLGNLDLEGMFTHFSSADEDDEGYTRGQIYSFRQVLSMVEASGYRVKYRHAANSAGVLYHPHSWFNLVRPGVSLYGIDPRHDQQSAPMKLPLKQALTFKAMVMLTKEVAPGTAIGYSRTVVTNQQSVIATLGVGYADGLKRLLSNKGRVIINDRYAPIVGRISMDMTTVDVTGIPDVKVGDEAIIIGRSESLAITADDVGQMTGTIPYEVLTNIGDRVTRVHFG